MPINPRGEFKRSNRLIKNLRFAYHNISETQITAYSTDDEGQAPPSQVHLLLRIEGLPSPAVLRFKSPDTLGFLVEELAKYRAFVWPEAEPVDLTAKLDEGEFEDGK